jgi:uncharacterized OB-fold protein
MTEKPRPDPSPDTEAFWERCNDGELVVQECTDCGERRLYPNDACPACWSDASTDVVCEGTGTVATYTVSHRPNGEAFADDVPYVLALIELDEGVTVMSNLLDVDPEAVSVGMDVELAWEQRGDQRIYQFEPAE